jgi:hypothetical protein
MVVEWRGVGGGGEKIHEKFLWEVLRSCHLGDTRGFQVTFRRKVKLRALNFEDGRRIEVA